MNDIVNDKKLISQMAYLLDNVLEKQRIEMFI